MSTDPAESPTPAAPPPTTADESVPAPPPESVPAPPPPAATYTAPPPGYYPPPPGRPWRERRMSGRVIAVLIAALVVVGCACGVGGFALGAVVTNHHSVVDQRRGNPQFNQYGNRPGPFNGGPFNGGPRGRVRQQPTPQPSAS